MAYPMAHLFLLQQRGSHNSMQQEPAKGGKLECQGFAQRHEGNPQAYHSNGLDLAQPQMGLRGLREVAAASAYMPRRFCMFSNFILLLRSW